MEIGGSVSKAPLTASLSMKSALCLAAAAFRTGILYAVRTTVLCREEFNFESKGSQQRNRERRKK